MEIIKELLNRTIQCPTCKGTGKVNNPALGGGEQTQPCAICDGTGVILDSFITDLMIKNGIRGRAMVEFAEEVFKHYENKLQDSYNRGIEDGKILAQPKADGGPGAGN